MRKISQFLKETYAELRKVVWPTRYRAFRLTIIVIIVTIIYGAFIAGVDHGLNEGIQFVVDNAQPGADQNQNPAVPAQPPNPQGTP